MTDAEINRLLRQKHHHTPPSRRAVRRYKMKARYAKTGRLMEEIKRTREKLDILVELRTEQEQLIIAGSGGRE